MNENKISVVSFLGNRKLDKDEKIVISEGEVYINFNRIVDNIINSNNKITD